VLEFIPKDNSFNTRVLDYRTKNKELVEYVKLFKLEVERMSDDIFLNACERFSKLYSLHDLARVLDNANEPGKVCTYITLFRDFAR
jgi:hypothetical protein